MNIFTMGFTQKKAEIFFGNIKENKIEILLDVRLNNQSQLAGFTKGRDLAYFLRVICECDYQHNVLLLCSEPTPEYCHRRLLAEYLSKELGANIIHI